MFVKDQSKKTAIEAQELQELAQILNFKYAAFLSERRLKISTEIDGSSTVFVEVLLENDNQSFYYPIEARIDAKEQNLSPHDAALLLIDYIDFYLDEYFKEEEQVFFNIDWQEYTFDGINFQIRAQVRNLYHEKLADQLLQGTAQA